jgi:hypothetical protein
MLRPSRSTLLADEQDSQEGVDWSDRCGEANLPRVGANGSCGACLRNYLAFLRNLSYMPFQQSARGLFPAQSRQREVRRFNATTGPDLRLHNR